MLLAAAGALGACGGGDDESSASGGGSSDTTVTTSSHTKAEFVKLANAICDRDRTKYVSEVGAYASQHEGEGTETQLFLDALVAVFLPQLQVKIEELRALGAPRGDEQKVEEMLGAMQEVVDAGGALTGKELKREGKLARAYGVSSCAYG